MKKIMIVLCAFILSISSLCYAEAPRTSNQARSSTGGALTTASTTTTYSKAMPLKSTDASNGMKVFYSASSANSSSVDVNIYFEESFQLPTTEGSADTSYLITKVIDTTVNVEGQWEAATIDTVTGLYGRFKIVGEGSNSSDTVTDIRLIK